MGLLDSILPGNQSGKGGGISPITLGLLALLAYRTSQGKGRLADMLPRGGAAPNTAPGSLPGRDQPGSATDAGGLGSILGNLLRGGSAGSPPASGGGGLGDLLRGGLGGILGGAGAGTLVNGGLNDLIRQFQQNGKGDIANSWVGRGPNREVSTQDLENALGRDTLETLSEHSGRPYDEVLSELSRSLPDNVDKLTPEGRVPTEEEAAKWAR